MQCHLLVKQLAASFKQLPQLSQHTLAEIRLLEAVIATHLGLIGTQTLEKRRQKFDINKAETLYLLHIDEYFSFPCT